jgi:hypothetical protein
MTQSDFGTINPATKSGTQLATDLNGHRDAVHSTHRGTTQPSYRVAGLFWEDTSGGATSTLLKVYDGSDWITLGTINETANTFVPSGALTATGGNLTGALNFAKGSNITAASTTDIGAATGNVVDVTGNTTITGLGTVQAGTVRVVRFTGAPLLTHNGTSLILPTGASIQAAAGDVAVFVSLGSGNWYCASYSPAAGPVGIASQAEAEAGSNNTRGMTPLRVAQAIAELANVGWSHADSAASTSGTSIDFTGIPAGVTEIVVTFVNIEQGTANQQLMVQIGDSGGLATSGYVGRVTGISGTPLGDDMSSGFFMTEDTLFDAAFDFSGRAVLRNVSGNIWQMDGIGGVLGAVNFVSAGTKTLSGVLDRLTVRTQSGATFSQGMIYVNAR